MISKAFKKQVFKYVMIDSDAASCHKQRGGHRGDGGALSGHGRSFGQVAGRQARQGHLHSGTLPGPTLGRGHFGGTQAIAGVAYAYSTDN